MPFTMPFSQLYILTELSANDVNFISVYRKKVDLSKIYTYGNVNSVFVEIQPDSTHIKMTLVTFNPSKSKKMIFSGKVNKPYHPPIYMNYQQNNEVNSHKHLRLYLSRDCTWHEHIEHIKAKAWQRIHVMCRLKFILDRKSLQTIYFAFIRPLLEFADVVRDNCSMYKSNALE